LNRYRRSTASGTARSIICRKFGRPPCGVSLPGRDEAELYWGPALLRSPWRHTNNHPAKRERLAKLSEGSCDPFNDVQGIIDRVVAVSVIGADGAARQQASRRPRRVVPQGRLTRQDL